MMSSAGYSAVEWMDIGGGLVAGARRVRSIPGVHGRQSSWDDDLQQLAIEFGPHLRQVSVIAKRDPPFEMT